MFGLFRKKTASEKLEKRYQKLLGESYQLSHSNRKASDEKMMEAEEVLKEIEQIKNQSQNS